MDKVKIEEGVAELAEIITLDLANKYQINGFVAPVGQYIVRIRTNTIRIFKCLDTVDIQLAQGSAFFKEKFINNRQLLISACKMVKIQNLDSDPNAVLSHLKIMENSVSVIMLLKEFDPNRSGPRFIVIRFDKYQNSITSKYFEQTAPKLIDDILIIEDDNMIAASVLYAD